MYSQIIYFMLIQGLHYSYIFIFTYAFYIYSDGKSSV
jgi:hypothetical protein